MACSAPLSVSRCGVAAAERARRSSAATAGPMPRGASEEGHRSSTSRSTRSRAMTGPSPRRFTQPLDSTMIKGMVPDSRDPRVLVVGAGSAGPSVAAPLRRRGIAVTVLERGDRVGAAWSSRYEELRLNTLRWLSALPGAPIPRSAGRWVTRDQYVAHLAAFATSQRIDVRFGAGVRRIDPEGAGWQV